MFCLLVLHFFFMNSWEAREREICTYRSASFVVVQVHFLTQCASSFAGIDEFTSEFVAKDDVVGTASPFLMNKVIS